MRVASPVVIAALCAVGCVTSPYDRDWLSRESARTLGVGLRDAPRDTAARFAPGVTLDDGLSASDAVTLALWNNAPFQAELARLGVARADLADAAMLPNPILSLLFPLGPRQIEGWLQWPIDVIWQRPARVRAASLDVEATARALVQTGLDTARDARLAFADAWSADRRAALRREAALAWRDVVTISEARLRAGDTAAFDLAAAQRSAAVADEAALRAEADASVSREQLRVALGVAIDGRVALQDPAVTARTRDPDAAVRVAVAARPDLRAAELAFEAAGARAGFERSRIVSMAIRFDGFGAAVGGAQPSVVTARVGPLITLPIFQQNQGGIGRAEAEVERALWRCEALRRQVVADVRQSHARTQQAAASLQVWRERVLPAAREAHAATQRGFAAGDVPFLAVQDAVIQLAEARVREVDLVADVLRADAALTRAVGAEAPTP